jgi:hypothetical protein
MRRLVVAALVPLTLAGCPRSMGTMAEGHDSGPTSSEPANANDVTRYPYEKKLKDVPATLHKDGVVRKSPPDGTPITTLSSGTTVTQIAETSGAFLVTYDEPRSGKRMMGWITENAFSTAPPPIAHGASSGGGGGGGGGTSGGGGGASHDAGTPPAAPPAGTVFTQPVNGQCPAGFVKSNVGCHRACSSDGDCPSGTKCKSGMISASKICTTG